MLVGASNIPMGPPAPMMATPHRPAGMNASSGTLASMTMMKTAMPNAIHSNCGAPALSTRNSATATQNIPATPPAIDFFSPFIFPPAAEKQAQPRTPTYQNMPATLVTFTHTASSTAAGFARDGTSMTSVTSSLSREFAYRDRKLGDTEAITVATASDVFYPTSTTTLLLRAARRALVHRPRSVLDLGCGCGIVAIVLAKCVASGALVCASDLSAGAVRLA